MKVLFICGCLEPGKDGVGDYVYNLAEALNKKGHLVQLLALNEDFNRNLAGRKEGFLEKSFINHSQIASLRIHNSKSRKKNFRKARMWIKEFDPDWISLQYVPNSFNKKGLPWKLTRELKDIAEGRNWHIMFHEVWVGISRVSPVKHRILGFLQKKIARDLVKNLNCSHISTSNLLYLMVLQSAGIKSVILPLFSNIPKTTIDQNFKDQIFKKLQLNNEIAPNFELVGVFGSIYPEAKIENVLQEIYTKCLKNNKKLIFISFGETGSQGINELSRLKNYFNNKILFYHLGPQPVNHISTIFQILDSAISCTPSQHIPKSGVFAAMKLHNLKIYLSTYEFLPEYHEKIRAYLKSYMERPAEDWMVETVSKQFLSILNTSSYDTCSPNFTIAKEQS